MIPQPNTDKTPRDDFEKLTDYKNQTVKYIYWMADTYFKDLLLPNKFEVDIKLLSPKEFFNFIQSHQYVRDKEEFLSRPKLTLQLANTGHYYDCDDRTIMSLSYFNLVNYLLGYNKYNTRVLVTGRAVRPHHVFTEYFDNDKPGQYWITYDPTYPQNVYGKHLFFPGFLKIFYRSDFK